MWSFLTLQSLPNLLLFLLAALLLLAVIPRYCDLKLLRQCGVYTVALLEFLVFFSLAWHASSAPTWQLLVSTLPLVLVFYHSLTLWRERLEPPKARTDKASIRVAKSILDHYGWDAIVARYVLPALLLPIVGLVAFDLIGNPPPLLLGLTIEPSLRPFEYGLMGAYIYVFLELGKRSVRNDITSVSIIWCLITLVVGPALAALIPSIFTATAAGSWSDRALWLFAGYSPRLVFRTLAQGVLTSLKAESATVNEARQIPLGRIAGIGPEDRERLAEEGIMDAHALACVAPVRLMRDTRFDNWRILSWVDQALLLTSIPEDVWRELLKRGYQGATDIILLVNSNQPPSPSRIPTIPEAEEILKEIATSANTTSLAVRDMLARLAIDPRTGDFIVLSRALAGDDSEPAQHKAAPVEKPQLPRGDSMTTPAAGKSDATPAHDAQKGLAAVPSPAPDQKAHGSAVSGPQAPPPDATKPPRVATPSPGPAAPVQDSTAAKPDQTPPVAHQPIPATSKPEMPDKAHPPATTEPPPPLVKRPGTP